MIVKLEKQCHLQAKKSKGKMTIIMIKLKIMKLTKNLLKTKKPNKNLKNTNQALMVTMMRKNHRKCLKVSMACFWQKILKILIKR